jgi:NDP-sugar pyrophosphorylase family protein
MNQTRSLVILAAGLGSRYGGLKQLDTLGPSGETILHYTIYDAIQAGFKKIVFIIKEENETVFREIFSDKLPSDVQIEFVFQQIDQLPTGYSVPTGRIKPWGTAHAVRVAAAKINEPFAIVNADDFYGRSSFKLIYDHLGELDEHALVACMVGYVLKNTLSENGTVSRGICKVDQNGNLKEIIERTKITQGTDNPYFDDNGAITQLTGSETVSMNLMGFTPAVFPLIENMFKEFLDHNQTTGDLKAEFFTPSILDHIRQSGVDIPVLHSEEQWFGITYKEDKLLAIQKIKSLTERHLYPSPLW